MPALTAVEARDLAASPYTQEELDTIFKPVDLKIQDAAEQRRFYVDVSVGEFEVAALTQWITAAGYTIQESPPEIEVAPTVRSVFNGDTVNVRIAWQGYEFRAQPSLTAARNTVVSFVLDTLGVEDGQEIYWQQVGTAPEVDFTDATNEGTETVAGGSASILRGILLGATTGNTIQIAAFIDFDGELQQVAISETVTITA